MRLAFSLFVVFLLVLFCPFSGCINIEQVYDPALLFDYLLFSSAAYCDTKLVASWSCPTCIAAAPEDKFTLISTFYNASTDIFAYVGVLELDEPEIVVCFRGTQFSDLLNWIVNLNFPEILPYHNYPNAFVHRGFWDGYGSVRQPLELMVSELLATRPNARISVTGHSLGAALATICATELKLLMGQQRNISLFSFASPRVGNWAFADLADQLLNQSFRLTHHHDVVVHLPPHDVQVIPFWHLAQEVFYPKENTTAYIVCDFSGEDPSGADSVLIALSVHDHLFYMGISASCAYG